MRSVGVRILKNQLSEYLRAVQNGETIAVTNHGAVVALLSPPDTGANSPEEKLLRLARTGEARLGRSNRPESYPRLPGLVSSDAIREALDWTRGER